MGVIEFKSSVLRLSPNLSRNLERVGLDPKDRDLARVLSAAASRYPEANCEDVLFCAGELWKSCRDIWHTTAPAARAFVSGAVIAALGAGEPTVDASLRRVYLRPAPTLSYAWFFLAIEQFDQARSLRLRAPARSAQCFRETVRILSEDVVYAELNDDSQRHALGRIGAAAVMLCRMEVVPLVDLLRAHAAFLKSFERGNDGVDAIGYLFALRLEIFRANGDTSFLQGLLKNKHVASRRNEPAIAAMLADAGARVALSTLEEARRSPREWISSVTQLRRNAAERLEFTVQCADSETQANRAFAQALWACIDRALESRDPSACRLPPTLSDPTYRLEQALQECASYGGDSQAVAFATTADGFLASEASSRDGSEPLLAGLRLRCLRFVSWAGGLDQALMRQATDELAHAVASGDLSDERSSALAIQYLASRAFRRALGPSDRALLADYLARFAGTYESATWPLLTIARLADMDYLPARGCQIDGRRVANGLSRKVIGLAAERVVSDESAVRVMIGRSTSRRTTYIVEGTYGGDAADRFVFKSCDAASAELEQRRLRDIRDAIEANKLGSRFRVPQVVGTVDGVDAVVLVLEREEMPTLADARGLPAATREARLRDAVQFLALIHGCLLTREGGQASPKRTWGDLRSQLKHPPISLSPGVIDEVLLEVRRFARAGPLLPKRDAHPSNWLSDSGHVCAIDPCGSGTRPLLFEFAQLVEDAGLLAVSDDGLDIRMELARNYLHWLDDYADAPLSHGLTSVESLRACLAIQMLCRAIFLLNRSYHPESDRVERLRAFHHGQALLEWLSTHPDVGVAHGLATFISRRANELDGQRVRSSRSLSYLLRHDATLQRDGRGWSSISDVESRLKMTIAGSGPTSVSEIAAHPAETRFQISNDQAFVRAGYGHSVGLMEAEYRDQPPAQLFHGTTVANAPSIRATGLKPMGRDFVHLVEAEDWAYRIGARRGSSRVLKVDTVKAQGDGVRFFSVADGMWLSSEIPASSISER